jgi:hypothetical protein
MITKKMIEILEYISMNGKVQVEVTPRTIKQNDSLYQRIWKLEDLGAIITERRIGMSSLHSITNVGLDILQGKC